MAASAAEGVAEEAAASSACACAASGAARCGGGGGGGGPSWSAGLGGAWGPPRAEFQRRKEQILASLDRSPKGSLDAPIVDFLGWLNAQAQVVTTSSCSGRIAVFLGSSDASASKGGEWLVISHELLADAGCAWEQLQEALRGRAEALQGTLASLLLEPFVLHAECADVETAQRILEVAREAGFRESGVSLGRRRVMVQLRTLALRLEVPLAVDGTLLAGREHFEALLRIANERLAENGRRVQRLWARLREALEAEPGEAEPAGAPWVLVCPQPMARAVKLAVEERGWMDESRKMAPFAADGGAEAGAPQRIGIPMTEAGAAALAEAPERPDAVAETGEPAGAGQPEGSCEPHRGAGAEAAVAGAGGASQAAGSGGKAKRPPTVAADLFALWRSSRGAEGPLVLQRSDSLPSKDRPPQRGAPSAAAARGGERDELRKAVLEVYRQVAADAAAELPREVSEELQSLGQPQWRGDVALLPRGALVGGPWERLEQDARTFGGLWEPVRTALGARLLARQQEIRVDDGVRGGAVEILAGSGDGWVVVDGPRGVRYTFDVTRCMFSEGNAAEKSRVAEWAVGGETVLDLYAGIGFWTLPLLAAGASRVFACEWNPHAAEALRRGLSLLGEEPAARCTLLEGDNRRAEVREATAGQCDRVLLGLIPTSRDGFSVATTALRDSGGVMHVHWNVPSEEEQATARAVVEELQGVLRKERGPGWSCRLEGVQRIKWFAPRVRHVRMDVRCQPEADTA